MGLAHFAADHFGADHFIAVTHGVATVVTATDREIQLPVNVVLAGMVPIKDRWREYDVRPPGFRTREVSSATPTRRLKGGAPTFTTRTDRKGYD